MPNHATMIKRVSLKDIAGKVGVSTALVSYVMNGLEKEKRDAIKNHNIQVPQEMALIGFDGNEAFDFFYSPLTYIEQPIEVMGKESVRI